MAVVEVKMPQMGESIVEGKIIRWTKKPGDAIARDEILLEIATDKVDSEIPSPVAGVLKEIVVAQDETVDIGTVIALIESEGSASADASGIGVSPMKHGQDARATIGSADVSSAQKTAAAAHFGGDDFKSTAPKKSAVATLEPPVAAKSGGNGEVVRHDGKRFYSPLVRRIAKDEGIGGETLSRIPGSGANGRVTKHDLLAYLEGRAALAPAAKAAGAPASTRTGGMVLPSEIDPLPAAAKGSYNPERVDVLPMDNIRRRTAEHMVLSNIVSPRAASFSECDMENVVQLRGRKRGEFQQREGFKLTLNPFFLFATVKAIRDYPGVNVIVDGANVIRKKDINLGIAVALGADGTDGLIVPVIKNADSLSMTGLARAANELAQKARTKTLKPDDISGGTFTVTNPGVFGNDFGLAIVTQPQVAILGIGAVKQRVVAYQGMIAIRHTVMLSATYDHRVVDGALGGQFLSRVCHYLENPPEDF
ncbi:MAG: 2-oxo acid dehydrogenase subunit E2 [Planctomycetes bacterium]|nr:2-oxo acid dehydrogenase subunit E2 [Planctomycetota bacterium]